MSTTTFDIVVVGGGVVGLAIARQLLLEEPSLRLAVLDKENRVAVHASGHNSGVLHAGFYYAPDSLKARLTRRGNQLLHAFIEERGLPLRRTGKVVVATDAGQLPAMDELARRAEANGVPLEVIDEAGLHDLEPLARTVERALWSPTTSVSDPVVVCEALAEDVRHRGADILLGRRVERLAPGNVITDKVAISAGHIVSAAGLYADRMAAFLGLADDYTMLPFKGLYWYGSWPAGRLRRHVYPVPDPRNPFLGVHLTVTVDGRAKIGPTAIPALWREDYGGAGGFVGSEFRQIVRTYPPFLGSPHHDALGLIREELPKYWRRHLVKQASALVPSVDPSAFRTRGHPGVRAQLFHRPTARLEMDFVVRGDDHSTHVLNAVSPAWTSALAVAEHVVNGMRGRHVI
jgi:L-2-hydroxyglutarate oxidase LhgO